MVDSENLCRRAMEIYGFPAQAAMVVEECSELTNAICKFRRGRVGEDDIITEIADVMIMCEHHPTAHNPKNRIPTPYLDKEGKVERRRKRRAYGSQGWKGWGGEIYFKKYGEIMMDVVDKKKARREAKKHIENELQDQL